MEKINGRISIITVCYNCKDDLRKTIESIKAQTYQEIEYIVVDGASTDGTKEILKEYSEDIDVCISEPDKGIYDAMNKGIKKSSSEWLLFMNAGDIFYNNYVLENVFNFNIPASSDFIYGNYDIVFGNGKRERRVTDRSKGIVHHQSSIYKRCLHEEYGYYIVTHPYIISDLLFFLSVPEDKYKKINLPIAIIQGDGVSSGTWSRKQAQCARYIYGIIPFSDVIKDRLRMYMGIMLRKLHLR